MGAVPIYTTDNMPVEITRNGSTTYITYNGLGQRVKKANGGSTTYYIGPHYEETNNVPSKYIFAGDMRIAKVTPSNTYYYHSDNLGSAAVMTDSLGGVAETINYKPFGEQRVHTGSIVTNYKFTDQELDPETGLYNYNARLYDMSIGRFISADTIVPEPFNPQSLNRYAYVLNNPLKYTDPSGNEYSDTYYSSLWARYEFIKYGYGSSSWSNGNSSISMGISNNYGYGWNSYSGGSRSYSSASSNNSTTSTTNYGTGNQGYGGGHYGNSSYNSSESTSSSDGVYLRNSGNLASGFGDTVSKSLEVSFIAFAYPLALYSTLFSPSPTQNVRFLMGTDKYVDYDSGWYTAGKWSGVAWELAVGGALSGPKGPLFGRARYRDGKGAGTFNSGDNLRIGWSWNAAKGRNYFGPHGGVPGTSGHWHGLFKNPNWMIPGPRGPLW